MTDNASGPVRKPVRTRPVHTRRRKAAILPRLLAVAAEADPDGVAVLLPGAVLRYRELDEVSSRLARLLIGRGVGSGDLVAVAIAAPVGAVSAMWAVAKTGAGFVVVDANAPGEQAEYLLSDTRPALGLTAGTPWPGSSRTSGSLEWLTVDDAGMLAELDQLSGDPVTYQDRLRPIQEDDIAYVTAGSTGIFDAVPVTQAQVAAIGAQPDPHLPEPLREFFATVFPRATSPRPDLTLTGLFDSVVAAHPNATAVKFGTGTLTYRELDARANRLARKLIALGIGPEKLVAVALPRSLDLVVALLATVKAGGGYLPVDPAYPADRITYLLADADPSCVVTEPGSTLPTVAPSITVHDSDFPDDTPVTDADRIGALHPDNLAYVIYTSGSTGRPKGVQIPHRNVVALFANTRSQFTFDHHDVWTMFHSYAFDFSVWELWGPLLHGGTLVVVDYETSRAADQFLELLRDERVTVLNQTPSAFYQLAEADRAVSADLPALSLRYIVFGGEALEFRRLDDWRVRHRETQLVNMYGITETTVHTTIHRVSASNRSVIGTAIPALRIWVLDDRLNPVPTGVPGEIYVSGVQLARGYLGNPGLTAGRFVANPFAADGSRLYRSGDLASWNSDGDLVYLGRADDQVKVRGYRIELGEIEAAVLASAPVRQVAVVVREDVPGDQRIVAYLVGRPEVATLRTEVARVLPEYMVPSAFVVVDAIPLTAHGKLDRKALPAPVVETAVFRAPANAIEEAVADVFAAVLGVGRIGLDDNFFALGGNSLLATQVAARLGAALDARVPARLLFTAPTVAALAVAVGRQLGTGRQALVAGPRPERIPLSMAQQRMWFLNQFDRESAVYNIPVAVRLTGDLDVAALRRAIGDVIARHEILRTVYPQHNGVAYQSIRPAEQAAVDLVPELVAVADVLPRTIEVAAAGFDVAVEIPLRASLFRVDTDAETEYVLVFVAHHICSDGWSMAPLTRDVMVAYAARSAGAAPDWAPLPVQYADFSIWQRESLGAETDPDSLIARQVDYWRTALADLPDELELPFDRPRPPMRSFAGGHVRFSIDSEVQHGLAELARAHNATVFMVLHTALTIFLARWSGTDDIAVGTAVAGRGESELDAVIGMFVNTLVLRARVTGQEDFGALLEQVREVDLRAFEHADIPFERLVESLSPDRSTARNPLFQVGFVFQNLPEATFELPGLRVAAVDFEAGIEKFDLSLAIRETAEGMAAQFSFARELFDEATIRVLADRFARLLAAIVARPNLPVGDLALLADDEYAALTRVHPEATAGAVMPDLLLRGMRCGRDRIAVRDQGRSITYGELDEYSSRLARFLISLGVGPERLVALAFPRSYQMLAAVLAVTKAGGAYVPVDPAYPVDRVRHMVTDSAAVLGLTTAEQVDRLPEDVTWLLLDHPAIEVVCARRSAAPITDADRIAPLRLHNPAYLIYTSGSTGVPKGVMVTHAGLAGLIEHTVRVLELEPNHLLLHSISPSFDPAAFEWLCTLSVGATLVILAPTVVGGPEFAAVLRTEQVTHCSATPAVLSTVDPTGVTTETLLVGGDVTTPELVAKWQPGRRYINAYGPTEATIAVTLGAQTAGRDITIGGPVPGVSALVLDARLRPVPPGVTGELYVAGANLARGYHARAGLTADRFVANPWGEPGSRMFRTGDLVRWNAPPEQRAAAATFTRVPWDLKYVGRSDFQVKIRGFRIELGEIDAVLSGHEDVGFAVTIGHETHTRETVLVSYVRAVPGRALDVDRLTEYAERSLPRHMVPATIVLLDEIPLTPVGKLDRKALPEPTFAAATFQTPATRTEAIVAEVFAEVLGVEQVGADDDFFARGGTSLLTLTLQHALAARLGLELPVATLFSASTVRSLAARIDGQDVPVHSPAMITADAVLGPEVSSVGLEPVHQGRARDVLLTGATGFVGAYLLRELLDRTDAVVWCLVRADSIDAARDRVYRALRRYQLWGDLPEARIVLVPGDLAEPSLGLSEACHAWLAERIEVIYHNGAQVNHLEPYPRLCAANVEGTREVLRLATTHRVKPVHFVSTINTVISTVQPGMPVVEATRISADELPAQGYIASKWAAEQLVLQAAERGVPARIYRPGLVSGDLQIGVNSADDSFWNMIRAAAILGMAPEVGDATISLAPVTYVARAIVEISLITTRDTAYHLVNETPLAIHDIFACLREHGLPIETETLETIQLRLADEANARYLAGDDSLVRAALLGGNYAAGAADLVVDCTNTRRALAGSAITCLPIDASVLHTYIGAFLKSGFLPTPIGSANE
ncbi:amino acid adenylation domain-containing protein [Nocardia sp. NPDC060256]|uniref:amino acid adenylation domain-containing protein n=1 Tax=unclassified Nocardia TaxID=2637762 RepID=UPI00365271BB